MDILRDTISMKIDVRMNIHCESDYAEVIAQRGDVIKVFWICPIQALRTHKNLDMLAAVRQVAIDRFEATEGK